MLIVICVFAIFFAVASISDYRTKKTYEKEVKAFWEKHGPIPDWIMDDGKAYVRYVRTMNYPKKPKYILK